MLCAFATASIAQGLHPSGGPVRILVAYPPGGVSDSIARALAERAATQLGVPVIVENRGGAGGVVAMESLKRAPPDGRTLVFSAISPLTFAPLFGPTGFDPDRDVTPVMSVMVTPVLVVGTRALAGDTLAAAISAARANPGGVRWATSGVGTTGHLVLQRVQALERGRHHACPVQGRVPSAFRRASRRVRSAVLERRRNSTSVRAGGAPQGAGSRGAGTSRRPSRRAHFGRSRLSRGQSRLDVRVVRAGAHATTDRVHAEPRVQCRTAGPCDPASSPCGRQPANGGDRGRFRGADHARARVWWLHGGSRCGVLLREHQRPHERYGAPRRAFI